MRVYGYSLVALVPPEARRTWPFVARSSALEGELRYSAEDGPAEKKTHLGSVESRPINRLLEAAHSANAPNSAAGHRRFQLA